MYPVHPSGAEPCSSSHLSDRLRNSTNIAQLSTPITSVARLRPLDPAPGHETATVLFTAYRQDPLRSGRYLQDVALCRPGTGIIESVRLSIGKRKRDDVRASHTVGDLIVESKVNARWYLPECADGVQAVKTRVPGRPITAAYVLHRHISWSYGWR
jgi:hypothetical protein